MNIHMTRRGVLAALAASVPVLATNKAAKAWTQVSAADAKFPVASGVWKTLEHVTDGTDPSTALSDPPAPQIYARNHSFDWQGNRINRLFNAYVRRFRQEA